jgi:putative aldouronate transport system substrate-binding protein
VNRKYWALFASIALAGLILSGCSGGGGSDNETLKVMVWDRGGAAPGTTASDNASTKFIQESVKADKGVDVVYAAVPRSGSDEKLNVMVAAGTAPDVIFTYTRAILDVYAERGGITDLSASLDQYGDMIKARLGDLLPLANIDGKQYAVTSRRSNSFAAHTAFIRKDWLDALGEPVPSTKDDLIRVLKLFKAEDPGRVGDGLVPWAMGGTRDSDKYYLSFVASYGDYSEETLALYPQYLKAVKPGAKDGYLVMNTLYNEGVISSDFALDTNDDKYRQDIINGKAGFFVEDSLRPYEGGWFAALAENVPGAEFVALNAFDGPDGVYMNMGESAQGLYIMTPKTARTKTDAAIKYLDWLANPENAMKVMYTPDYTLDETGVPITRPQEELLAGKYAGSPSDLAIVGAAFDFLDEKANVVRSWRRFNPSGSTLFTDSYLDGLYDAVNKSLYTDILPGSTLPARRAHEAALATGIPELAYRVIAAPPGQFDSVWDAEYKKLVENGLDEVVAENKAFYDSRDAR